MSHVFISYSKKNIDFARHLRHLLQDYGFPVWMDETQLNPSEQWFQEIEKNIVSCSAFVVIMSDEAKELKWVERELLIAEEEKKLIAPVLLNGRPWRRLGEIQYENMTAGIEAVLTARFVRTLEKVVSRSTPHETSQPVPLVPASQSNLASNKGEAVELDYVSKFRGKPFAFTAIFAIGIIIIVIWRITLISANSSNITPSPTATPSPTETITPTPTMTDTPDVIATELFSTSVIGLTQTQAQQLQIDKAATATAFALTNRPTSTPTITSTNTLTATATSTVTPTPTATVNILESTARAALTQTREAYSKITPDLQATARYLLTATASK